MTDSHRQPPLAAALGRIPSGLFVVTFRHDKDETGMLASWIQQCSFEPPQVSVAIRGDRDVLAWLEPEAPFTVNILDESQTEMLVHFGRGFALGVPAFEGLDIERPDGAPPVLTDSLAYLECRVRQRCSVGDHELVIGRIVAGNLLGEGKPMVHVRKSGLHY